MTLRNRLLQNRVAGFYRRDRKDAKARLYHHKEANHVTVAFL